MPRSAHWSFAFALMIALVAACGDSKNSSILGRSSGTPAPGDTPDPTVTSAPKIATTSVKDALTKEPYSQPLAASGGTEPLAWSLKDVAPEHGWIQIDATTGTLSGTPTAPLAPAKPFTVQVKDRDGRADQKDFSLGIHECSAQDEGKGFPCYLTSATACLVGQRVCSQGVFEECTASGLSTSIDSCGPDCLTCGPASDICRDGKCQCGTAKSCSSKDQPTCCTETSGSVCTDLNKDPKHCGDCETVCDPDSKKNHVVPTCIDGTCKQPSDCEPGWRRCPVGSSDPSCNINIASDPNNCGGCGTPVPSLQDKYAESQCLNGQPAIKNCTEGWKNCNGVVADGCECSTPTGGSLGCTTDGKCDPRCPTNNHQCGPLNNQICYDKYDLNHCGTDCTNLTSVPSDTRNCGWCGHQCGPAPQGGGASCSHGGSDINRNAQCQYGCPAGQTLCGALPEGDQGGGYCADLSTDRQNCGVCGRLCPAVVANGTATCRGGECVVTCNAAPVWRRRFSPEWGNCDGDPYNGCETSLTTGSNCGECGNTCDRRSSCGYECTEWVSRRETESCRSHAWMCVEPPAPSRGDKRDSGRWNP